MSWCRVQDGKIRVDGKPVFSTSQVIVCEEWMALLCFDSPGGGSEGSELVQKWVNSIDTHNTRSVAPHLLGLLYNSGTDRVLEGAFLALGNLEDNFVKFFALALEVKSLTLALLLLALTPCLHSGNKVRKLVSSRNEGCLSLLRPILGRIFYHCH